MKLCIPVLAPNGLDSEIQPHLPDAEHLFFFDTETRDFQEISLRQQNPETQSVLQMDAILCGSLNRTTLQALTAQGIDIYGIATNSVVQAIAQFEDGQLEAFVAPSGDGHAHSGCSGGCGHHEQEEGHCGSGSGCGGHAHGQENGGCGGGCSGHSHGHEHGHAHSGCGCSGHHAPTDNEDFVEKPLKDGILRVAICSQNRKTITEHAGKCRKFWIYDIRQGEVIGKTLLELPIEQALHSASADEPHPLDDVHALIAASMGSGLQQRLRQRGIYGIVTEESDPDQAIATLLESA